MSNITLLNHFLNFYNVNSEEELAEELEVVYEQYAEEGLINVFE